MNRTQEIALHAHIEAAAQHALHGSRRNGNLEQLVQMAGFLRNNEPLRKSTIPENCVGKRSTAACSNMINATK